MHVASAYPQVRYMIRCVIRLDRRNMEMPRLALRNARAPPACPVMRRPGPEGKWNQDALKTPIDRPALPDARVSCGQQVLRHGSAWLLGASLLGSGANVTAPLGYATMGRFFSQDPMKSPWKSIDLGRGSRNRTMGPPWVVAPISSTCSRPYASSPPT